MKKVLTLLVALTMVLSLVSGCSKSSTPTDSQTTPTTAPEATTAPEVEATTAPEAPATAAAKTGLSVITSLGKSTAATADAEGLAQTDAYIFAVLVGEDGKIAACKIDAAQTKINFSTEGKITSDINAEFKSKQQLGDDYGMRKASAIGKEWNEQADAFAAYVVGKTVEEVKGIAINEEGIAGDADLAASVTVHIGDFVEGVAEAVANAQELGASSTDKLGLGVTTDIAKSTDATADAAGLAQAYTNIAVSTVGADGKITSCFIDAVQGNVNFDTAGVITTDLTVAPLAKQVLKDEYGMKKASSIGKEWYEQANAFAAYVTGKTTDEVTGIALNEEGKAGDADLAASVTVHIGPFMANIAKAVENSAK
ncbi:MAG: hypothetical protein K0S04_3549 [Herbinix sp.]|jgi:hypothetical protein|nr:hypothetical protein [Herbinix sp.]